MKISMIKKHTLLFLVLVIWIPILSAKKVATLQDVVKPDMILSKNDKLYVLERTSIFIYSLKDFRLIKKFGREGEGPMEFRVRPFGPPMTLSFYSDYLVVNSNSKMSYLTLDGKFVNEERCSPNAVFYKIKGGYLSIGAAVGEKNRMHLCYRIHEPDFQSPRVLYQSEITVDQDFKIFVPMNALNYYPITPDKIFIVNGIKGFVIDCFDHSGKKLFFIEKKKYEKIKVTEAYKKQTLAWFKNHSNFKAMFEQVKNKIIFKEYFPAIKTVLIDNNKLYVITNKMKKGLWECIVIDFKGNELNRTHVPMQDSEPFTYYPLLCTLENGTFYSLIENEDDETWELHKKKVK